MMPRLGSRVGGPISRRFPGGPGAGGPGAGEPGVSLAEFELRLPSPRASRRLHASPRVPPREETIVGGQAARVAQRRRPAQSRRRARWPSGWRSRRLEVVAPHMGAAAASQLPWREPFRGWSGNRRRPQVCVRCTSRGRTRVARVEEAAVNRTSGGNHERESRLLAPNTRKGLRRHPSGPRVQR